MEHWPNIYSISPNIWHPSYYLKSTLQSFGKKILQMGNALKKCKVVLKDAEYLLFFIDMSFLYEKVASKVTSAEPPGRGNGTDQLGCLTVPGRFHYPSPGAAYSHFQYSLCSAGHARL